MKTKNIIIFSIISSFFLVSLISIWKILATLQGIKLDNLNFQVIFLLGFFISSAQAIIGNKLNNKAKIKFILKLISVNFKPCRVAIIFQIELIRVRKTEDINK